MFTPISTFRIGAWLHGSGRVRSPQTFRRQGTADAASLADFGRCSVFGDAVLKHLPREALASNYDVTLSSSPPRSRQRSGQIRAYPAHLELAWPEGRIGLADA